MEVNAEVLKKAIKYANERIPADKEVRKYFIEGSEEEKKLAECAVKEKLSDWNWEIYVRAYYDGVQSIYTKLDSAITNLSNSTIPPAPSQEFEL